MNAGRARWQFWIDRGGTFTDVVGRTPEGELRTAKLLSDNPGQYPDAVVEGIRRMLALEPDEAVTPSNLIESVKMGTTVATNALLERKGVRTALLINRGFADVLRIGTQQRPRLFDLHIVLPEQLYEKVIEFEGRFSAKGEELEPLNLEAVSDALERLLAEGIRSIAIVSIHGYRYPKHERLLADLAHTSEDDILDLLGFDARATDDLFQHQRAEDDGMDLLELAVAATDRRSHGFDDHYFAHFNVSLPALVLPILRPPLMPHAMWCQAPNELPGIRNNLFVDVLLGPC